MVCSSLGSIYISILSYKTSGIDLRGLILCQGSILGLTVVVRLVL